jgi:hypothetical protein
VCGEKMLDCIAQCGDLKRLLDPQVWNGTQKGHLPGGWAATDKGHAWSVVQITR